MVNLSELQNIEPINLSINLSDPNILETAVSTANETTGGYLGLGIGLAIYIFMMYQSTREGSLLSLDFVKASLLSSSISIVVMVLLLGFDMISNFMHLMWFVVIFVLSLIGSYILKDKE